MLGFRFGIWDVTGQQDANIWPQHCSIGVGVAADACNPDGLAAPFAKSRVILVNARSGGYMPDAPVGAKHNQGRRWRGSAAVFANAAMVFVPDIQAFEPEGEEEPEEDDEMLHKLLGDRQQGSCLAQARAHEFGCGTGVRCFLWGTNGLTLASPRATQRHGPGAHVQAGEGTNHGESKTQGQQHHRGQVFRDIVHVPSQ